MDKNQQDETKRTWQILVETAKDGGSSFDPSNEPDFEGTAADVNAHMELLRANTGRCHAATAK